MERAAGAKNYKNEVRLLAKKNILITTLAVR
jgi:hypothetical protein